MGLHDDLEFIVSNYEPRSDLEPGLNDALLRRFEDAAEALQQLVDRRETDHRYTVRTSPGQLDGSAQLPMFHFSPSGEGHHQRNPQLHCLVVLPEDCRKLYILLTDHRGPTAPVDERQQRKQIEQVRVLLQRETDQAWEFTSGKPKIGSPKREQPDGDALSIFAEGSVFYRDFDAELLPGREKIFETLDALLALRELYTDKFRSQNLDELLGNEENKSSQTQSEWSPQIVDEAREPDEVAAENIILYGPPGTGKTYSTTRRALELCGELDADEELSDVELAHRFRQLRRQGRIEFVTFHQSYGYEEFVEGIRPDMEKNQSDSDQSGSGDVIYDIRNGKFKKIALLAASEGLELTPPDEEFEARWEALRSRIEEDGKFFAKSLSGLEFEVQIIRDNEFRLVRRDDDRVNTTDYSIRKGIAKNWWDARDTLGTDYNRLNTSLVKRNVSRPGNFTGYWIVYRLLMEVDEERLRLDRRRLDELDPEERQNRVEDYVGETPSKVFGSFENARDYVIVIDEINRANISKVMGELITLLEPDKRLRAKNEITVSLPYSGHRFGVPPNLHVLGTMNTADRSIALMDTALRRRFNFEEMMPDVDVVVNGISGNFGGESYGDVDGESERYLINLTAALFETVNDRISFLYDRDHQIGHSYLMNIDSLTSLRAAFVDNIIPLLQEYFYGSWERLCIVLGCPYNEEGTPRRSEADPHAFAEGSRRYAAPMIRAHTLTEDKILRMKHPEYEDRLDYFVDKTFTTVSGDNKEGRNTLRRYFEAVLSAPVRKRVRNHSYINGNREQS